MPLYHRLGAIPKKRHTAFRKPDGSLYAEELMGNKGFVGPSSLLYHLYPPTRVRDTRLLRALPWQADPDPRLRLRHFETSRLVAGGGPVLGRVPLLFNADVALQMVLPTAEDDGFYRNGQADEIVYVSDGEGVLESELGALAYGRGDYLVVPRGVVHRYRLGAGPHRLVVIESRGYVRTPRRYRNEHGQMLEGAPFSERDIRRPDALLPHDERGAFRLVVKQHDALHEVVLDHHPLDVVGWDGYYYPWAFQILDFEPIVGAVHQPPPVHQTFEGDGFVVCSFVPRPYDFGPNAVPAPYHHSNVMSDEVIYYASQEFMSRRGIGYGSITLHPDGMPHGPHPGRAEASIGLARTDELAVMLDTFRPLRVTAEAAQLEDAAYGRSWLE